MLKEHAKLMKVFSDSGEIVGRKKLQKIIYIAKKLELPFYEKYDFHFYGPYSEELTLQVEELCNLGFLHEVKEKKGGYYQYRYSPNESGKQFLSQCELDMRDIKAYIDDVNGQSSRFLELVSTILYFEGLEQEEIREKVFTVKSKQRYTDEEFDEAVAYIKKLRDLCS
ncbi:YwgA family protein [Bacillus paralicheniformis]|uniref:YwgA family protein n=1 Tax=Bacillus paralicheniformis TaxID=1648923 RepID=UPI002DBDD666|nr:YwgA family protein [Bacillus paralicheniformis]MEC1024327.1 YwgA family protein [Bacillus paralicheniformis]MEC1026711.1 YwgA family protein [Bacillus paralicheniformis]MEC1036514.1 YwgA family protein [Bacillus paralicheniformis]MEC1052316.1 YwgA family protein [Bacillus paralicheniformis]MEC1062118.1 YwgA family protein [Bacillus paralicheniformis]